MPTTSGERLTIDPNDGRVHLCYAGTVLPNGVGALSALLDAVRRLAENEPILYRSLRLHFFGTSNQTGGYRYPAFQG